MTLSSVGIKLDDAREERAFRQLVEDRRQHQAAHGIARHPDFGAGEHVGNQFAIVEQQIAQLTAAAVFVVLVALERRQDRAEQIRRDQFAAIRPSRSLQSQTSVSLVTECSRIPRCKNARNSSCMPCLRKNTRNLQHRPRVIALHQLQPAHRPARAQRRRQRLQDAALFRRPEASAES